MIRDEEIKRLTKYAQGLNTSVKFVRDSKGKDAANWTTDGSEIAIYIDNKTSKLDIVLSLIHEIGHHLAHIHLNDRELDEELDAALDAEDEKKKHRRKILNWEKKGTQYWEIVYKETDLNFPKWHLHYQMEYDIWQYELYYETGKFPIRKERLEKRKELKKKYQGKFYE